MFLPVCTQVPPNILDSLSTESTVAVRENQNITLTCKADGYPTPKLMWKREDGQNININRHKKGERTRLVLDDSLRFVEASKRKCFTQPIRVILKFLLNDRLIFPIRENRSEYHEISVFIPERIRRIFPSDIV